MIKNLLLTLGASFALFAVSNHAYAVSGSAGALEIHPGSVPSESYYGKTASYSAAKLFVKSAQLHKSLSLLLLDSVKSDAFVEQAIEKHGFEAVKNAVVANIKITSIEFREQWDGLLADIYSKQFSSEVLNSIANEGEQSPHFVKFVSQQKQARTDQTLLNSELFQEARSELVEKLEFQFTNYAVSALQ